MPDEKTSESVKEQSEKQRPNAQVTSPPAPPDNKPSAPAKPISENHEKTEIQKLEERLSSAEKWMIWLTGAIAFWGLCGVIVGVLQWSAMKGQLAEMKSGGTDTHSLAEASNRAATTAERTFNQNKDFADSTLGEMKKQSKAMQESTGASKVQSDAAKSAVENARQSLQASIEAFHLDQRPWVTPFDFRLAEDLEYGKPPKVEVWSENTGKTPALNVMVYSRAFFLGIEPIPPIFQPALPFPSRGFLSPGTKTFRFIVEFENFKPTLGDVADYRSARKKIYIHGLIRYHDSFDQQHWSTFCIWHSFGALSGDFGYCRNGNNVDHQEAHK
jgi:hypothetical protein